MSNKFFNLTGRSYSFLLKPLRPSWEYHIVDDCGSYFNKNKTKKDGLQSMCRDRSADRSKQYYAENKPKHIQEVRKHKRANYLFVREQVVEYLLDHPCVMCGESNPIVLEFDHLRDKCYNVSRMLASSMVWETILKEIEKCQVLCANCHRIKTAKDFGWHKHHASLAQW